MLLDPNHYDPAHLDDETRRLLRATVDWFEARGKRQLIADAQAEKSRNLKPYEPTKAERIVTRVTQSLAMPPNGFFPTAGSVYGGGGFAAGLGYRHWYGDANTFETRALYSIRNYKLFEIGTLVPGPPHDIGETWRAEIDVEYRDDWEAAKRLLSAVRPVG